MTIKPYPHQEKAIRNLDRGKVLVGRTGSGKSFVGLGYLYKYLGGSFDPPKLPERGCDLYIITTARKRDEGDWVKEAARFGISKLGSGIPNINMVVDSWNNIHKYVKTQNAFFIFDEQKAIGSGVWAKSFIKIAKKNHWIMLTATPADNWIDLIPVFVANGFYKNRTQFKREHVEYAPYVKYPKIVGYKNERKLAYLRKKIFVVMTYTHPTVENVIDIRVEYNKEAIKDLRKRKWNYLKDRPIRNLPEFNALVRRVINTDSSRIEATRKIYEKAKKLIIFYNFDYELELLRQEFKDVVVKEYNGHKHEPIPDSKDWVYLVQYMAGNEAWECFETQHMLFYSMNYSYRIMKQAMGRTNRLTTPFKNLFYYRLISSTVVDRGIKKAYSEKRDFNERGLQF